MNGPLRFLPLVVMVSLFALMMPKIGTTGEETGSRTGEPIADQPIASASLLSEVAEITPGQPFDVALRLVLPAGWHTYWRNPGDAGAPTAITWMLPPSLSAGAIEWPVPERFTTGPVVSYGYQGEVWLLTRITPSAALSEPRLELRANVDWLVCAEICVPEQAVVRLELPVAGSAQPTASAKTRQAFERARAQLPQASPWPVTAAPAGDRILLDVAMNGSEAGRIRQASFFPDQFGVIDNAAAQAMEARQRGLRLSLARLTTGPSPSPVSGVLVIERDGNRIGYQVTTEVRS